MKIVIRYFVRIHPKFKPVIYSIIKPIILIGVNFFSFKEDIGFEISFVPISWWKKIYRYIPLLIIHNTLSLFIMTAPTVHKKVKLFCLYLAG
jgi:hypothetical protein